MSNIISIPLNKLIRFRKSGGESSAFERPLILT